MRIPNIYSPIRRVLSSPGGSYQAESYFEPIGIETPTGDGTEFESMKIA